MGNNTLRLRTRRRLQLQQPWYASDHSNPFANPHGPYVWTLSLHCWPTWRSMLWSWSSQYMHRPKETQCCVKPSNPKHQECVYELQDHLGVWGGHSTWKNPGNKYGQNMTRINISKVNHSKMSTSTIPSSPQVRYFHDFVRFWKCQLGLRTRAPKIKSKSPTLATLLEVCWPLLPTSFYTVKLQRITMKFQFPEEVFLKGTSGLFKAHLGHLSAFGLYLVANTFQPPTLPWIAKVHR